MTDEERQKITEFCADMGAPWHAPTIRNYINSGGEAGARWMLDKFFLDEIADLAGVRFPAGW